MCVPDIHVVNPHEDADTEEIADEVVDQSLQWEPEWRLRSSDVLPIHAPRQKAQAFISIASTEEVGEDHAVSLRQTEDTDPSHDRHDVLRKHLPYEEDAEHDVEQFQPLRCLFLISVQCFKKSVQRQIDRIQHFGGIDESLT